MRSESRKLDERNIVRHGYFAMLRCIVSKIEINLDHPKESWYYSCRTKEISRSRKIILVKIRDQGSRPESKLDTQQNLSCVFLRPLCFDIFAAV